jgi:UPF0716 family protein affecting phage T7 exclusion
MSIINDNKRNGPYILGMIIVGVLGFFACWIMQEAQTAGHIPAANRWMVAKIVFGAIGVLGFGWAAKRSF